MPRKEVMDKRRANGKCTECGVHNPVSVNLCEKCRMFVSKRAKRNRKKRAEDGRCIRCGRILDDTSTKKCQSCALARHTIPFMLYPSELNRR